MQNTIGKAITNPSQMKKPLIWAPMDQEWKKTLEDQNTWWYKDKPDPANERERIAMEKAFVLRDRLLGFGGNIACMDLFDEDLEKIMERGQFWYGEHARMKKRTPVPMPPQQCVSLGCKPGNMPDCYRVRIVRRRMLEAAFLGRAAADYEIPYLGDYRQAHCVLWFCHG